MSFSAKGMEMVKTRKNADFLKIGAQCLTNRLKYSHQMLPKRYIVFPHVISNLIFPPNQNKTFA